MPDGLPRPLIALAAIVALAAIIFGVKDFVSGRKGLSPSATTSAPAAIQPSAESTKQVTKKQKISSAKISSAQTKRSRRSAQEANAGATAEAGMDDLSKPLISDRLANNGAEGTIAGDPASTAAAQAGNDALEAADRKHQPSPAAEAARSALFVAQCVPLPNVTDPRDADGPYYQNWAREYSCVSWR